MSSLFMNAYYLAINFNAILYGTELVLYGSTMNALFTNRKRWSSVDKFYMAFSTALLILVTIYMSTEAVFGQEMWIVHAGDPNGAVGFFVENVNVWYQTMGTTASVVLNLFADALLIYRMYVVWTNVFVVIFPCILYLATFSLGVVELFGSGKPNADFFEGTALKFGVAYYALTISLNVIATAVICGRLVYLGRVLTTARGRGANALRYTGTMAVVVESALPYSAAGIAFLVSYGIQSDIAIMFGALYGMFTCISPQLIVLRVVNGAAWTRQLSAQTSALEFENLGTARTAGDAAGAATTPTNAAWEVTSTVDHKSIQEFETV